LAREKEEEKEEGKEQLGWKKTGGIFRKEGREKRGREGRQEVEAINGGNHSPSTRLGWAKPLSSRSSLCFMDFLTRAKDRNHQFFFEFLENWIKIALAVFYF